MCKKGFLFALRRGKEALKPLQCERVSLIFEINNLKTTLGFGKADRCTCHKISFARPKELPDRHINASPGPKWHRKDVASMPNLGQSQAVDDDCLSLERQLTACPSRKSRFQAIHCRFPCWRAVIANAEGRSEQG